MDYFKNGKLILINVRICYLILLNLGQTSRVTKPGSYTFTLLRFYPLTHSPSGTTTLSIKILSISIFIITTLNIKGFYRTLNMNDAQHKKLSITTLCQYGACH